MPPTSTSTAAPSRCAVYTRNDHTAAADRVQDLFIPVGFTG